MAEILAVALKEIRDGFRNRWVLGITALLAVFALGLAWFGGAASGQVGFTAIATTIVSLASLAVFVIPLIALLLCYDAIIGEDEQGTLLLLLSYPLSRLQLLAGKFIGHMAVLAVSTVAGFGAAGIVIAAMTGNMLNGELWGAFGFFIASSVLLGWTFIALGYLVSIVAGAKAQASAIALVVWFFFVLLFDLALLGLLVAAAGSIGTRLFPWLLLLNPTDVFRLANLTGFHAVRIYSGLASVNAAHTFRPSILLAVLMAWTLIPFGLAARLFNRRV